MFWVVTALTGVGGFCRIIGVCFVFRVFASGWVFWGGGFVSFFGENQRLYGGERNLHEPNHLL